MFDQAHCEATPWKGSAALEALSHLLQGKEAQLFDDTKYIFCHCGLAWPIFRNIYWNYNPDYCSVIFLRKPPP